MTKTMLKDASPETSVTGCQVQVLNGREYTAQRSGLRNSYGTKRSELLVMNKRTGSPVTRKTLWQWDCILQAHPKTVDYRRDAFTQKSLWDKGQEWSPHQVWCLEKVADFMQTKSVYRNTENKKKKYKKEKEREEEVFRYPIYEELDQYLSAHSQKFTFKQFMKEIKEKYHAH